MGQAMTPVSRRTEITRTGFKQELVEYEAQNCSGCPLRGPCHKGKGNKKIAINHNLRYYREKANELLTSEKGCQYLSQRGVDVETLFGIIKQNKGFNGFLVRGLAKANVEIGLIAIAHNIQKMLNICCPLAFNLANPFDQIRSKAANLGSEFVLLAKRKFNAFWLSLFAPSPIF